MIKATCKQCRTENMKLFLKGEKCASAKCPFAKKSYVPGQKGGSRVRKRRISEYGEQLREKQKVKRIYGIREKQFRNYFIKANKTKGVTGENLLKYLEQRLDNVVYRLGFADSRDQARQMVSHNHITVNKKKVNIASYQIKTGDEISVSPKFKKTNIFKELSTKIASFKPCSWLILDNKEISAQVKREPLRDDIDESINESLVIEYYSR